MRLGNAADITGQGAQATSPRPCVLYTLWREPGALVVLHPERQDTLLSVLWTVFAQARAGCPQIVVALPGLSQAFRQPGRRWSPLLCAWFLLNAQLVPALACARHFLGVRISFVILQQPSLARRTHRLGFTVFPSFAHLARAHAGSPQAEATAVGMGAPVPTPGAERQVQHLPL